ncbi:MAG TPA: DUF3311 domain-containing protein [Candidatus Methylacidiphilales bacterium]
MKSLYLLLLFPCVVILWVSFYNIDAPRLGGFPFFYWFQLLWIPFTSLCIYLVDRKTK